MDVGSISRPTGLESTTSGGARADGSGQPVDVTQSEAIEGCESEDGRALYFVRSYHVGGIMRMSFNGDPPVLLVPGVERETWAVTKQGIVYLSLHDAAPSGKASRQTV